MAKYFDNGSFLRQSHDENAIVHDEIPSGTYHLRFNDQDMYFYLEKSSAMKNPSKIYGNARSMSDRIINTYVSRDKNTGVLLSGQKGSGKTLQLREICIDAEKQDIPVILITQKYEGDAFTSFMRSIQQLCIIVIDEFEKVFGSEYENREAQSQLLSLMDGTSNSKLMFILTINETRRVNQYLLNRPNRLFYHLTYTGLDSSIIDEYLSDHVESNERRKEISDKLSILGNTNFDMMACLVEEAVRYPDISVDDIVSTMNIGFESKMSDYKVEVFHKGEDISHMMEKDSLLLKDANIEKINGFYLMFKDGFSSKEMEMRSSIFDEEGDLDFGWRAFDMQRSSEIGKFVFSDGDIEIHYTEQLTYSPLF